MCQRLIPSSIAAMALLAAASALAFEVEPYQPDDAVLENLFWHCDAQATLTALPAGDGAICSLATEQLKQRRFGGDFGAMLAWWQARKVDEHARRGIPVLDPEDLALQAP